jgi:three-Cys-motif partner protein
MTSQDEFGGAWTQQKLECLGKYLRAYTTIFKGNSRARFFSISYVDAFAGTGTLQRPELGGLADFIPELGKNEEEYRKGSVKRALEIEPPFDTYVFVEKSAKKCQELQAIANGWPSRNIKIVNDDANSAILDWCRNLDTRHERAVVFLDPFGASVKWEVIAALGQTRAVD